MSTRSTIIVKIDIGYAGIYCHGDGYPDHVWKILTNHYTDPAKIAALLTLGDISSLGESIEAPSTIAYARDLGEKLNPARIGATLDEIKLQMRGTNYTYVFDGVSWFSAWRCWRKATNEHAHRTTDHRADGGVA